jgi:mannose-6-phosphate isomerase-like protein (cupin superfamily)
MPAHYTVNGIGMQAQWEPCGARRGFAARRVSWHGGPVMDIVALAAAVPFVTKDGSEIRELLAYRNSAIRNQSLAEARVPAGQSTQEHYHAKTEEIYFITAGEGRVRIEGEEASVQAGDAIAIPPGKRHKLWNTGRATLSLLCCCAPCYEHGDTFITET